MNEPTNIRYTRIRLQPRGPFHFGKRGVSLNETEIAMPADSFFSALCNALRDLDGMEAVPTFLARFPTAGDSDQPPPLRITSLMPYVTTPQPDTNGAGKFIYLLPMPLLHLPLYGQDAIGQRKELKRIQWVSAPVFEHIIHNRPLTGNAEMVDDAHDPQKMGPRTVQKGQVWVTASEHAALLNARQDTLDEVTFWSVATRPRVAVDRVTGASAVYSSGSVYFAPNAGLYLLIEWLPGADAALRQQIETAIQYLGDSGIGGERTYGYGHFTPTFEHLTTAPIVAPANASHVTTLAPYLPQPSERASLSHADARYEIILRRGWLTLPGYTSLRRPTVRMVNTGAILSTSTSGVPTGYVVDATPTKLAEQSDYVIHRYGLCWPVAVRLDPTV
ncbi:MAG: type III-A CRISPR-associated RAMP protein Csm4 [Caldilineaceae bacterium]